MLCYWQKFYQEILGYRFVTTMQRNTQDPTMHKTLRMKYSHQCSASAFAWDLSGYFCWLLCQTSSSRSVPAFCNVCTTCIHLPLSHTHTAIHLLPNQISVKTIHQPLSFILPTHTSSQNRIILVNIHSINEKSLLVHHPLVQVFALTGWHLYHPPNCCPGVQ